MGFLPFLEFLFDILIEGVQLLLVLLGVGREAQLDHRLVVLVEPGRHQRLNGRQGG